MKELLNKEIEMEDGSKYIVIETASIEKKNYVLLSNISDVLDSEFAEVKVEDGNLVFETVIDTKTKFELMKLMQD